MIKSVFSALSAPLVALVLLSTTADASAVMKPGANDLNRAASTQVKPASTNASSDAFVPAKYRKNRSFANFSNLRQTRSFARMASAKVDDAQNANLPQMNGAIIFDKSWGAHAKNGLYSLPTKPGTDYELLVDGVYGSGVVVGDRLYVVGHIEYPEFELDYPRYTVYDMETGDELFFENLNGASIDWSVLPVDMDVDPVTGDVYGITYNSTFTGYQLSKLTFTDNTVKSTKIADLDPTMNWNAMAFDATGKIYAISKTNEYDGHMILCSGSALNTIDRATGEVTLIGETGFFPEYPTSAAIDRTTGRMFWAVAPYADDSFIAEVNLTTGAAVKVLTLENEQEITSLYVPEAPAEDKAPAKITNLSVDFENGSLSGKVSFKAPETLFDGTRATGALTYEVTANEEVVATGNTSFGADVTADVTMTAAGLYKFIVLVSNSAGPSPMVSTSLFVGNGVPAAPNVWLRYADGKMNLTWDAIAESSDGGYIDPEAVTYTVTRFPDNKVVATGISTNSFTEEIPQPAGFVAYYYTVVATYAGNSSVPSESNKVALGAVTPPYEETFDTEDSLAGWTIIDNNTDLRMWMWSTYQNLRISFHQSNDMDDWAITPGIKLESGMAYQMSFDVYGDGGQEVETIEVKMGDANTVAAMTTVLVEPTNVISTKSAPLTLRATITPETSGVYFIGFHGMSQADQFMLNLDNVSVAGALNSGAPAAPTAFTAVADPEGAYKATLTFTTPDKSIAGGAIWQNFTKVVILRDGKEIKSLTGVAPKSTETVVDLPEKAGTYNYSVACYNMFGQGMSANASVYVGTNIPSKPAGASVKETSNLGEVTVDWTPVTTDINGKTIPASKVTYTVAAPTATGWSAIKKGLTGSSYTFQAATTEQDMVQYAVFAETEGGVGEGTTTKMIPVGPAYKGLAESFPNGYPQNLWAPEVYGEGSVGVFNDESGISSQDADNGFIGVVSEKTLGDGAALASGKISLEGMDNPAISFYTYNMTRSNANLIDVLVREAGQPDFTALKTVKVMDVAEPETWGKVIVPLTAYKGKTIQIQLKGTIIIYPCVFFDNVKVASMFNNDLAVTSIAVPATATTGSEYNVLVTVSNEGTAAAARYTVKLFADDEQTDTYDGTNLAAGATKVVTFACHMHPTAKYEVEYRAEVVMEGDEDDSNNVSEFAEVKPVTSTLPVPEKLSISSSAAGNVLEWNAPDFDKIVATPETDDIEHGESFAQALEGWTFVDRDGKPVGGFDGASGNPLNVPNIIGGQTSASFFVFDSSLQQFGTKFAAHSGDKFLAALCRADDGLTDDWAISPELDGSAQVVAFYAKSFDGAYPEKIQVLYSTGSVNPADFIALCDLETVPASWTPMAIDLPEGAKRFAIRSSSEGSWMLMIDDITFTPGIVPSNYKITGYNVYREEAKINTLPVAGTTYTDPDGTDTQRYFVTALYDKKGESGASNTVDVAALASITNEHRVFTADGCVVVECAEKAAVAVHGLDGKTRFVGNGDAKVKVPTGVYIVTVDKSTVKVVVK